MTSVNKALSASGVLKTSRVRGSGIPAGGPGWGGPAKGAGSGKPRTNAPTPGPGRGHFTIAGEQRAEREARQNDEMRGVLYHLALNAEAEPTRVSAAVHLLNRNEGLPVQKLVTQQQDALSRMTEEQLEAAAAETRQRIAAHQGAKALPE